MIKKMFPRILKSINTEISNFNLTYVHGEIKLITCIHICFHRYRELESLEELSFACCIAFRFGNMQISIVLNFLFPYALFVCSNFVDMLNSRSMVHLKQKGR
jgi:hypothetical protein